MHITPITYSTNNYHRAPAAASPARNTPVFKALQPSSTLNKTDLEFVKNILNKCLYGKKSMLADPDFKIELVGKMVLLENFYKNYDSAGRIEGICEELVYKTGKIFSRHFKNKYNINAVNAVTSEYGMIHNFLIFTPKTKESDETIASLLKVSKHLKVLTDYMENAVSDRDLINAAYIKLQMSKLELKHKYFDNCTIVDPSLKKILPFTSEEAKKLYPKIKFVYGINDFNPLEEKDLLILIDKSSSPLGLVKDIAPEALCHGFSEKDLISLEITSKANAQISVYNISGKEIKKNILDVLPEKHILKDFYNRMNNKQ